MKAAEDKKEQLGPNGIADTDDLIKFQEKLIRELSYPSGTTKKHSLVSHNFIVPRHPYFMIHVVCDLDALLEGTHKREVVITSYLIIDYRHPIDALAMNEINIWKNSAEYSRDINTCVESIIRCVKLDFQIRFLHLGMDIYGNKHWFFDELHEMWVENTKKMLTGEK